eukprot:6735202-Prymnesium_polylepis.1
MRATYRTHTRGRDTAECGPNIFTLLDARLYGHHAAAILLAIVTGEAEAIVSGVSRCKTALAGGEHREAPWLNAGPATIPRGLRAART